VLGGLVDRESPNKGDSALPKGQNALHITGKPYAFNTLNMKPLRLVPRLVLRGLVDRENLDKGHDTLI